MVARCAFELLPFSAFLFLFVVLFTDLNRMVRVDNDINDSKYPGIADAASFYLETLRSTVGAAAIPKYDYWLADNEAVRRGFGIALVWVLWLLAVYFN